MITEDKLTIDMVLKAIAHRYAMFPLETIQSLYKKYGSFDAVIIRLDVALEYAISPL